MSQKWPELNQRYFDKHGGGCGPVGSGDQLAVLKTLTKEQVEALVYMALLGDIHEVPLDEDLMGKWAAKPREQMDDETEMRRQFAAAVVYLSGRLAEDIPLLME